LLRARGSGQAATIGPRHELTEKLSRSRYEYFCQINVFTTVFTHPLAEVLSELFSMIYITTNWSFRGLFGFFGDIYNLTLYSFL